MLAGNYAGRDTASKTVTRFWSGRVASRSDCGRIGVGVTGLLCNEQRVEDRRDEHLKSCQQAQYPV